MTTQRSSRPRQVAKPAGESWVLVTDAERQPRGWAALSELESRDGHETLGQLTLAPYGHTFRVGKDSLRAALDATVLSPTGLAVGVDEAGPGRGDHLLRAAPRRDPGRRGGRRRPRRPPVMSWAWDEPRLLAHYLVQHLYLALLPVLFGIIVAVPVGVICVRYRWTWPPILSLTSIFYALPSMALFVVLIDYTGLTDWTVIIPLTLFSLSVLIPNVVDGLRSVPPPVRQAATAMGFGRAAPGRPGRAAAGRAGHHRGPAGRRPSPASAWSPSAS